MMIISVELTIIVAGPRRVSISHLVKKNSKIRAIMFYFLIQFFIKFFEKRLHFGFWNYSSTSFIVPSARAP